MTRFGYFISLEEQPPKEAVAQAKLAEQAGFDALWISDHFHPWNDEQGQAAFVWSVIGALSEVVSLPVTTSVTCPTIRIHPAIIAQAAATASVMLDGRFVLGVGSGEALNEHVLGDRWPSAGVRLEMLEEAVEVIRELHTGRSVTRHGKHYTVEDARIYTLPEQPVPIYVSGFGPKAMELAGRIGDGFCSTVPDPEAVQKFRDAGGGDKPTQAGFKVAHGPDAGAALDMAHRLWANEQAPGELAQVLYSPKHFEQVSQLVTKDMVAEAVVCGNDVEAHVENLKQYVDAGYDEVYINQIGPTSPEFFRFYAEQVFPRFR